MTILEVQDLKTYYSTLKGDVKAVDDVRFQMEKGEALGLVGESGCGKTTLALADYRWKKMSYVFQGAMNALNPVFKVGDQIAEAITIHEEVETPEAMERAQELFRLVGIDPDRVTSYPHELSGGMKQRAMIAMALACNPDFIIADEPTTALDVIVQAQTLEVMNELQKKLGLTTMIITHDLSVVAQTCSSCAIMYAGNLVEYATIETIFSDPAHPYTKALIGAFPSIMEDRRELVSIPGVPPNLLNPPTGCRFNPRCPNRMDVCTKEKPNYLELEDGHTAACHLLSKEG
jgi:peptide/nickel transport system ATP-binding protein